MTEEGSAATGANDSDSEIHYFVDGAVVPASEATVSVRDRGFMYGDGAFETLRVYGGEPFKWAVHANRLQRSCDALGFGDVIPSGESLRADLDRTLEANGFEDAYAKVMVTRGVQPGKLTPDRAVKPTVAIIVSELPRGGTAGERIWDRPARLSLLDRPRIPDAAVPSDAKTHNYLNGILARLDIRDAGYDEVIMPTAEGNLAEGATSNLFFVIEETLHTPAAALSLLPGVTRGVVLELADYAGISAKTSRYDPGILADATEVFVTNSTWEIRPVTRINDLSFDVGAVTERLQERFDERVEKLY